MFRKTNPQRPLFTVESRVPQALLSRLKGSWAEHFRHEVLPILMASEEDFSRLYGITGQPNFSVARMLGLCFLQELNAFTDQETLDAFGFDIRWQYALDVTGGEAYLSRRSFVEFRRRLVREDPSMILMRGVFERIGQAAIDKLGISVSEQRLDSTHIESNIHTRGRLSLFQDVIEVFLKSLDEADYAKVPARIRQWHEEESNGWFGMGATERKAKVAQLARYMYQLLECFSQNERVTSGEAYQLLSRLFGEQCEVVKRENESGTDSDGTDSDGYDDGDDDNDGTSSSDAENDGEGKVVIKVKKKFKGAGLQSAFDPDASYGHKGQGYSAHITETCNNPDAPEIITDCEVHGAVRSDMGKASGVLNRLEESDKLPDTLYIDGGYPSVPSTYDIIENRGIELMVPVNRGPLDESVIGREQFEFDDDGYVVSCPEGHPASDHRILSNNSTARTLHAIFDGDICRQCDKLETCPVRAPNHRDKGTSPRNTVGNFRLEITPELRLRDEMFAKQQTTEWKERYKIRSGIEATMSELKRGHGMGKLRVRGLVKVTLAVLCKATACNIKRWNRAAARRRAVSEAVRGSSAAACRLLKLLRLLWCRLLSNERILNISRGIFYFLKFQSVTKIAA